MGRPSKSVELSSKNLTKEEKRIRQETENLFKGNEANLEPPSSLNANQRKIYKYIVSELKDSKVLGNLDSYMLEMGATAIDRLRCIEKEINQDFSRIYDKDLMQAKSKYTTDFFKFIQEACLSPQSRAKMGILATNKKMEEADPLLKVLKGS
jgi:P27 family predicted phage terminase small subunit